VVLAPVVLKLEANALKPNSLFRNGKAPPVQDPTKNPNLGKFWRVLQWKILVYFMTTFGLFCGHLVYFSPFWFVVPRKIWQPCSAMEEKMERLTVLD
jgi:hypothetical protein